MAAVGFSPPKQWEDWCNWLMGLWLCLSPWALHFDYQHTETATAVTTGALLILAEVVTLSVFRAWEEWINVALGIWLVVCSFVLNIGSPAARVNFVVVGLLVTALALYEVWSARREPGIG